MSVFQREKNHEDWTSLKSGGTRLSYYRLDEVECMISDLCPVSPWRAVPAANGKIDPASPAGIYFLFQTLTGGWGEAAGDAMVTGPT
jgi:glutamine synthetase